MSKVKIKFWGVRGSTPAPSRKTVKYGGNTPCLEITFGKNRIICDAGTGIRCLGEELVQKKGNVEAAILLSHIHWDHISGLPFFLPIYSRQNSIEIIGPQTRNSLKNDLVKAISPPLFPVSLDKAGAKLKFKGVDSKAFKYKGVLVIPFPLNHPGGALGWRFEFPGEKSLVYVSDNEPDHLDEMFASWAHEADVLVHDAQYTPDEYRRKKGWGHSPYPYTLRLAAEAGVKKLILNHFDPTYSDTKLEAILKKAKKLVKDKKYKYSCELAREGKTIII